MQYHRIQRAAGVVGRTAHCRPRQALGANLGPESVDEDALADAGLAADRDDLPAPLALGALPSPPQQARLLVAPDQLRHGSRSITLILIGLVHSVVAPTDHAPDSDGSQNALQLAGAEILVGESLARQFFGHSANNDAVAGGEALQPGGNVRCLTHHRALLGEPLANHLPHHDHPRRDADAHCHLDGFVPFEGAVQLGDSLDDGERAQNGSLGVALQRFGIAEIDQNAVAHVASDKPPVLPDDPGAGFLIGPDHVLQVLRVELGRQRR